MTFSWSTATSPWWMTFSRGLWVKEKGQHSSAPFGPFQWSEIHWYCWSFSQSFLSRICCLSFFHWLWMFDSLSDIWCSNHESWLMISWLDAHEFMRHSICHRSEQELSVSTWNYEEWYQTYFRMFVRLKHSAHSPESPSYSRNKIRPLDWNRFFHNNFRFANLRWQTKARETEMSREWTIEQDPQKDDWSFYPFNRLRPNLRTDTVCRYRVFLSQDG
jgi:hypothetical protein